MASIVLEDVHKTYPNGHVAARGLDLKIEDGEFVVLVGPSGCGKSTTLRMVAGLETPTSGRIQIGDRDVTDVAPQDRDIAMVFQTYALYPHKTVRDNLGFGLRMRGVAREVIADQVEAAARKLGLEEFLDRKPAQLSGGQRQRVALGRAMVRDPKAFLFDEPLSNLDAKLRVQTRAELARMHRRLGATMLYVTHDQEEAMTLGDRVAVMHEGRFQQVAPPMEVYGRPANLFVAGFIGSPAMNFIRCRLQPDDDRLYLRSPFFEFEVGGDQLRERPDKIDLGVRPQDIEIVSETEGDLSGTIEVIEPLGNELLLHITPSSTTVTRIASPPTAHTPSAESVDHSGERQDLRIVAPTDSQITEDQRVGLRLRRERLHLFDVESGQRLN